MATRLEDLGPKLDALSRELEKIAIDIPLVSANAAEGILKSRAFGQGAKATDGSTLPTYSKEYKKYNKFGKKKTSSTWDLQAEGDLIQSIDVVSKKNNAKLSIVGQEQVKKTDGLEDRAGKVIFELSDQEKEQVLQETLTVFRRMFQAAVKKVF